MTRQVFLHPEGDVEDSSVGGWAARPQGGDQWMLDRQTDRYVGPGRRPIGGVHLCERAIVEATREIVAP